jgi:hypothetical protein
VAKAAEVTFRDRAGIRGQVRAQQAGAGGKAAFGVVGGTPRGASP